MFLHMRYKIYFFLIFYVFYLEIQTKKKFDILLEELNLSLNECTIIINSEYIYLYKYVTVDKVSRLIYKFKKSSIVF